MLDVLREDPEDVSLEIDFKRRDGIPFYAIIKASVQVEEGGRRVINGTIEDITKRKVAEHALKASEEKFSRLFQLSPDAIVLINLNNDKVLDVNETFSTMLGIPERMLSGIPPLSWECMRGSSCARKCWTCCCGRARPEYRNESH